MLCPGGDTSKLGVSEVSLTCHLEWEERLERQVFKRNTRSSCEPGPVTGPRDLAINQGSLQDDWNRHTPDDIGMSGRLGFVSADRQRRGVEDNGRSRVPAELTVGQNERICELCETRMVQIDAVWPCHH